MLKKLSLFRQSIAKFKKLFIQVFTMVKLEDVPKQYLKGGFGALCGIELKGGVDAGKKFINALKLLYHVANIGDARSLAIPSSFDNPFTAFS
jgi:O-acetylhomoserine (thiol)-lyase